ncbi:Nucleolar protein 6 [Blyttiomyces sp. JEL0837]|nr:Nucleolar protein 6 [Blyttiomyces sp. JEL0837]
MKKRVRDQQQQQQQVAVKKKNDATVAKSRDEDDEEQSLPAKKQKIQSMSAFDDDEEDDEEEDDDDDDDEMDGEANGDEDEDLDDNDEDAITGHGKPAKPTGSKFYKAPTNEEIQTLKQTTDLFQSNLFKLQIDELLKEVTLDYVKSGPLDRALHKIKEILDGCKDVPEMLLADAVKTLQKKGIQIPFPHPAPDPDAKYKFGFVKPTKVFIAGSYLLKTLAKNPRGINVDVAVEMPQSIFTDKDHVNHRYFYKRAFYLSVIASELKSQSKKLPVEISFTSWNGDRRKPIIELKSKADGSDNDFSKLGVTIRIIPTLPQSVFSASKLAPARNNVRLSSASASAAGNDTAVDTGAKMPPTPRYNSALLIDTCLPAHLNLMHHHLSQCTALKDAIVLGKVWMTQRGFLDSFGSFVLSMIMGYLLRGGDTGKTGIRLSNSFSSYQLIKLTIEFLANHNFDEEPIFMTQNGRPLDDPDFGIDAFKKHFDVVIVDPSGRLNLAAFISRPTLDQVQYEARASLALFEDVGADRFEPLFLKNLNTPLFYSDTILRITAAPIVFPAYKPSVELDFPCRRDFLAYFIPRLLRKGLKTRAKVIVVYPYEKETWAINTKPDISTVSFLPITIGLVLDPDSSIRIVELGPISDDKAEINDFRRVWGNKSELRRFKDGTIAESVVWDTDGSLQDRSLITGRMSQYLISRHVGIEIENILCWGGQLEAFLKELGGATAEASRRGTFQNAIEAFNTFAKEVKGLDGLPLSINRVIPCHPGLRYTSVFIPQPLPTGDAALTQSFKVSGPILRDHMNVVIEFESSLRWPSDLEALQQMKLAFYIKIAELMSAEYPGTTALVSKPTPEDVVGSGFVDVTSPFGYTFRVRIKAGVETQIAKSVVTAPGMMASQNKREKQIAEETLEAMETLHYRVPYHASRMQNMCLRFPFLQGTVRLLKRFVSSHLLSRQFSEEALELIAARVFMDPSPFADPPASSWLGFLRVLSFLKSWDWKAEPLVVEYEQGEFTADLRQAVTARFERARNGASGDGVHAPMRIVTLEDLDGTWWTADSPNEVILKRLKAVATASLNLLEQDVLSSSDREIARIFATPNSGYDFIVRLDVTRLPRYRQSISFDPDVLPQQKTRFKNLAHLGKDPIVKFLQEFDPVDLLIEDIKSAFGDALTIFHDKYGGDVLAIIWNRKVMTPQSWKVNVPFNTRVTLVDESASGKKKSKEKDNTPMAEPNWVAIAAEIARLGSGLVVGIDMPKFI